MGTVAWLTCGGGGAVDEAEKAAQRQVLVSSLQEEDSLALVFQRALS